MSSSKLKQAFEEDLAGARKIRDLCAQWIDTHRAHCPAPDECREPLDFIACIAHTMGMRVAHVSEFAAYLTKYEERCPNCAHQRN